MKPEMPFAREVALMFGGTFLVWLLVVLLDAAALWARG
ncbi:MAG: hypothetical protein KatS3mg075_397 [Meiothermus sp.]|nr:MAG: hypothetical protein KatS3mg075_397 [Meiothermus sp.]